jgi:hypothetical protein
MLVYTDPLDAKRVTTYNKFVRKDMTTMKPKIVIRLTRANRYKQSKSYDTGEQSNIGGEQRKAIKPLHPRKRYGSATNRQ